MVAVRQGANMSAMLRPHRPLARTRLTLRDAVQQADGPSGNEGPPAHPPELTYPCCLPALGEFSEMTPHEGSGSTLAQTPGTAENGAREKS